MTAPTPDPPDEEEILANSAMQAVPMQVSSPLIQDCLFFAFLSLDVRLIIYDFLYGWLPPLPYKKLFEKDEDCRGLILACKQANMELADAAARHLKLFFDRFVIDFEKDHKYSIALNNSIPLHQGWGALRNVTLVVDLNAIHRVHSESNSSRFEEFRAEGDLMHYGEAKWRTLLSHPFDKVTLLVTSNDPASHNPIPYEQERSSYSAGTKYLRITLSHIVYNIGEDWTYYQNALDHELLHKHSHTPDSYTDEPNTILPMPNRCDHYTKESFRLALVQHERLSINKLSDMVEWQNEQDWRRELGFTRIQTNHICLAWNLLPLDSPISPYDLRLEGGKYTYPTRVATKLRRINHLPKSEYEDPWPFRYQVSGANDLVGEIGIRHPKRWTLGRKEVTHNFEFADRWVRREEVESEGLGKEIKIRNVWAKRLRPRTFCKEKAQGEPDTV